MKILSILLISISLNLFANDKDDFILNCAFSKKHNFNAIKLDEDNLLLTPLKLYLYREYKDKQLSDRNITLLYGINSLKDQTIENRILTHRFNTAEQFNDIFQEVNENIYLGDRAFTEEIKVSWKSLPQSFLFKDIQFSLKRNGQYHCNNNQNRRRLDGKLNIDQREYEITCVQTAAFKDSIKIWDCLD